ncbi:MAG TPA: alcohol dehydrogenase catalytic domain-containing protein [Pseudonocardiaceae bacterium]|nr:alcohol dehydrogenase catalytic domain-containing protein [Pseudonocardiaceae bacterium]
MRAALLTEPEQITVATVADPVCGIHEVVVRMRATGLCGTDLAMFHGARPPPRTPWILGHEGVGEIVAVGANVVDRVVGQRVVIEPDYCCFTCPACRRGHTSSCVNRISAGINHPGVLAEHVAVPASFAWPTAEHVPLAEAVCVEPLTVARAAVRRSGIGTGDSALVVGAGSQGLFLCRTLVALGVLPFVVEPDDERLLFAEHLGAQRLPEDVTGLDYLFDTSGAPAALGPALGCLRDHGVAVLVGMHNQPPAVRTAELVRRQLTLIGSFIYDHPDDFATTIRLLENSQISTCEVPRARYPLSDVQDAFSKADGIAGKSWIEFHQDPISAATSRPHQ